ncbi:MAG: SURF1 family protein [Solimonas sp.]
MKPVPATPSRAGRSPAALGLLAVVAVALFAGLLALGSWQVHRLAWKLDLIARVDARVHAPPAAAPDRAQWPGINAENDEYRHVALAGRWLPGAGTLVQAVTEKGPGFWVLAPLQTADGDIVLVNRGFVPAGQREAARQPPPGPVAVTGLLRLGEPGGGFLRRNDAAADRWYSRDVAAIAAARGLPAAGVAPYFVDADAGTDPEAWPSGGLTVVRFHNSHLVYAITWYTLALMVLLAAALVARHEWRLRRS